MKIPFLMKKSILAYSQKKLRVNITPLIALLYITSMGAALAHDVTVNINGTITNTTCSVSSDSIDKQVNLGRFWNAYPLHIGTVSQAVSFSINLENCGAVSKGVQVSFSGTPDTDVPNYFKLDPPSADSASGFAIKLMDENKKLISVGDTSKVYSIANGATTTSLLFYAQMVETNSNIKTGIVRSSATFKMIYP